MVNDHGQIYTIEGVAAAILMLATAYLVVSTTTVLTPQDVHIIDMQLEQLGNDVLASMDTPNSYTNETNRTQSNLSRALMTNDTVAFNEEFQRYLNATPGTHYNYSAKIYYRTIAENEVNNFSFTDTSKYYRENAVTISRWVYLPNFNIAPNVNPYNNHPDSPELRDGTQSVLLEVLLWRQ